MFIEDVLLILSLMGLVIFVSVTTNLGREMLNVKIEKSNGTRPKMQNLDCARELIMV